MNKIVAGIKNYKMKRLLTLLFIIILTSCGEKSKNATDTKSIEAKNNDLIHVVETSRQIFELTGH